MMLPDIDLLRFRGIVFHLSSNADGRLDQNRVVSEDDKVTLFWAFASIEPFLDLCAEKTNLVQCIAAMRTDLVTYCDILRLCIRYKNREETWQFLRAHLIEPSFVLQS